jgi:hypothetical protein
MFTAPVYNRRSGELILNCLQNKNYKTLNTLELIIPANFDICCSVGRVAADGVGLLFGVMECGVAGSGAVV